MKKILSLGLLTLIFSLGANNVNAVPFNYKYEIRTNSLSYNDQLMGYSYKKIFIEIYEKICLLLPENYHDEAIRKNIDKNKYYYFKPELFEKNDDIEFCKNT